MAAAAVRKPYTPRPWAPAATQHLLDHKRCALWAPMGSGKSAITLTALDALDLAGADPYPALAIGPLRVARKVWREEVKKWDHLKGISVMQVLGDADTRSLICDNIDRPGFLSHQVY